jgi:hypothetical protein
VARKDTFDCYLDDLQLLDNLILNCRMCDPGGYYVLQKVPLDYSIMNKSRGYYLNIENAAVEYMMFHRLLVIPSASIRFWKNCRRMISVDGAHHYGQLGGVILTLTVKDANNHNMTLMYCICKNENADNWGFFMQYVLKAFPGIKFMISDILYLYYIIFSYSIILYLIIPLYYISHYIILNSLSLFLIVYLCKLVSLDAPNNKVCPHYSCFKC